jgi:hypothetical protein
MRMLPGTTLGLALLASLAACSTGDPVSPARTSPAAVPSLLLSDGVTTYSDSTDASGNTILVQEIAAAVDTRQIGANGEYASYGSVTIKSVIPRVPEGATYTSMPCITHSIEKVETVPGWTYSIKKPGGCDRDVLVSFESKSPRLRAEFKFSMVFGKTVIDAGAVR